MNKGIKITWDVIYKDFKKRHPKLKQRVLGYESYDYATIMLIFPDRVRMTYNYDTKELTKLSVERVDRIYEEQLRRVRESILND